MNEIRRDIADSAGVNRRELQGRLDKIGDNLTRGISHSTDSVERQFKESRALIQETAKKIAEFERTNEKIAGFAGQLQSLENILLNPKQRGVLGEYYLETMLKNVFEPGQYQMQYKFPDGEIVDAVIFYQKKILPIDSKFSMENYNKMISERDPERKKLLGKKLVADFKNRIQETARYIKVKHNTFDFAFMFIPSEGVFYDVLAARVGSLKETSFSLMEYAHQRKVIIVSPSSFFAYLQTILHGLRAVDLRESVDFILKRIEQLNRHLVSYEVYFSKLGKSLSSSVIAYNQSSKEFAKIDKDIYRITEGREGGKLNLEELERPSAIDS
jgi:DNA recombination protein RmuC